MHRTSPLFLTALGLGLHGCQGEPASPTHMVRDSAGVTIVESLDPAWRAGLGWRVAETPSVSIGVTGGDPRYELFQPRSALKLSDGRIVIGNNGTREIRYYDAAGTHLLDVGGRGGGPGEFGRLDWVGKLPGDSVFVYDQTLRRITVFDPAGDHIRDISLQQRDTRFFPVVRGRLSEDTYLGALTLRRNNDDLPTGLVRDSVMLLSFDGWGQLLDTIGVFPNRTRDVQTRAIGERRIRGPADVAFSPRFVWTVTADRIYAGNSQEYEIRTYSEDGELRRLIRREHEPVPITRGDQERLVQEWRDIWYDRLDNPEIQWVLHSLEESHLPPSFPAFDPQVLDETGRRVGASLLVDSEANLWVAEYRPPSEDTPRWSVFDRNGRWLGEIAFPERFVVTDIGTDYVMGWWRDDLGVESVMLYDLIKPETSDRG
jgi:hypothetical protein